MGGFSFQCRLCERWFTSNQAARDHLRDKHEIKNLSAEELKKYNGVWHKEKA